MIYHLALLLPTSDSASLHRTARRARARANRQLGRGLIAALRRGLRRQAERSARRRAEAVTLRELRQLSDRALADIGLERAQIRDIARSLAADRARGPGRTGPDRAGGAPRSDRRSDRRSGLPAAGDPGGDGNGDGAGQG